MGAAWMQCGCRMDATWVDGAWVQYGCSVGAVWVQSGCSMDAVWVQYGCSVGAVWVQCGCSVGSCNVDAAWVQYGCSVGTAWVQRGYSMGAVWMQCGCMQCACNVDAVWMQRGRSVLSKQPCTAPASQRGLTPTPGAAGKYGSQAAYCCSCAHCCLLLLTGAYWCLLVCVCQQREGSAATHHENGCCEPGMAELAKNPAKICWMILGREAGRAEQSCWMEGGAANPPTPRSHHTSIHPSICLSVHPQEAELRGDAAPHRPALPSHRATATREGHGGPTAPPHGRDPPQGWGIRTPQWPGSGRAGSCPGSGTSAPWATAAGGSAPRARRGPDGRARCLCRPGPESRCSGRV